MIPRIIAVALISALVGVILSEMGCRSKRIFIAISVVVMLLGLSSELAELFSSLSFFAEGAGVGEVARCALKIVGLGYVFGISADIAEELSEKSIASLLTLFGRIEMLAVALPYIKKIAEMGAELIK